MGKGIKRAVAGLAMSARALVWVLGSPNTAGAL